MVDGDGFDGRGTRRRAGRLAYRGCSAVRRAESGRRASASLRTFKPPPDPSKPACTGRADTQRVPAIQSIAARPR